MKILDEERNEITTQQGSWQSAAIQDRHEDHLKCNQKYIQVITKKIQNELPSKQLEPKDIKHLRKNTSDIN